MPSDRSRPIGFGVFELDLESGELRKQGKRLRLQEQPFRVLAMLVRRPGQVVSRDEIREALWPDGVTVDFDHSVNKAVNKLRETLGDSAESPRFIETLPRRGYRFICPVVTAGSDGAAGHPPVSVAPEVVPRGTDAAEEMSSPATAGVETAQPAATRVGTGSLREDLSQTPPALLPSAGVLRSQASGAGAWRRALLVAVPLASLVVALVLWWRSAAVVDEPDRRVMLVVLPFRSVPEVAEQEYFVDGLTEEMIAQVGRVQPQRLGVIAATSAQRYKGTSKAVGEIARELAVDYLLEGSVRRDAGRVRITGQLVRASDQTQVWAETFERDFEGVFDLQRDVAERIAQALALELLHESSGLSGVTTRVPEAHDAYLRGRYAYAQRTKSSLLDSVQFFDRAAAADPRFALAYVGAADSYNLMAEYGYLAPSDAFPASKAAASRALALEPNLAEGHANLAWSAYIYDHDFERSEQAFRRAIALNPGYASAHQWYASLLRSLSRHDEADEHIQRAQALDPVSPIIQAVAGWHHYLARRFDDSVQQCLRIASTAPEFPRVYSYLGWSYLKVGKPDEAVTALERALMLSGDSAARRAELAHGYAAAGRRGDAERLLAQLLADEGREYVEPDLIARIYVALGDHERAFQWLGTAREQRAVKLVLAGVDPAYDEIRQDPRFSALLRAISLEPRRYVAP